MKTLKHATRLFEGSDVVEILTKIETLSDTEKLKAFFLGQLVRARCNSLAKSSKIIKTLETYIETNELSDYYNREKIPGTNSSLTDALFVVVGLAALFAGIFQITKGFISVGFDSKFHLPQVDGGGYAIIFGLVLLSIGVFRLKYFILQNQLLRKIRITNSNKHHITKIGGKR